MKVAAVDKTLIAFLIEPPPQALPAVQEAWDYAADARFGLSWIEKKLTADLKKVRLHAPSRGALSHWVGAIQANLIARPKVGDQVLVALGDAEPIQPVATVPCAEVGMVYVTSVKGKEERAARERDIVDPAYRPLTTADFPVLPPPTQIAFLTPEDTLREVADRMIHEEEQALQQGVREQARRNVATRLRTIFEQLEALDA